MSKRELLAVAAYVVVTFVLAVLWHVVLFGATYDDLGYFGREPSFVMGFTAILIQAFILAVAYSRAIGDAAPSRHWPFIALAGSFLWTSNALAFAAKSALASVPLFLGLEAGYFALNFLIYGLLVRRIFAPR